MPARIAVCLMPESRVQARLDAAIAGYAARFGLAPFRAHLTLAPGADPSTVTEDLVAHVAARFAPMRLEPDGILETASFTRSFALRFRLTPALLALRAEVLGIARFAGAEFIPHISLVYGSPPDRAALVAVAEAFGGPMLFDALETNHHSDDRTQEDIAALRSGPRHPLVG